MAAAHLKTRNTRLSSSLANDAKFTADTENIEHSDAGPATGEKGSHAVVTSEEDLSLTQEDIDFVREFDESGRGKKVLRRADWHLVPALVLIYLVRRDNRSCWRFPFYT